MWPLPLLLLALHHLSAVSPFLLYGCIYSPVDLCEGDESCYPDGLFGQCYSPSTGAPEPTKIGQLDEEQLELLTLELTRLAKNDQDWGDSRTQCVLAYYKLSMAYNLQYDPEFCNVRYPTNIWALIQLIDIGLNENGELRVAPSQLEPAVETELVEVVPLVPNDDDSAEEDISELLQQISEPPPEFEADDVLNPENSADPLVENYIQDIVARENPDLSQLSDEQLNDLLTRLFQLKKNLDDGQPVIVDQDGEAEEAIPLDEAAMADEQPTILKKDSEHVGNVNLGLDNTEHKIVKGRNALSRVVGNRVYLKVNKVKDEKQLAPLVEYLENTIALPNNLIFDDFQFENGQLSMRISRFLGQKPKSSKRIDSVEGVAQAVYKRRKDIARFSGAEVKETGIGSGEDTVPVESTDRDWLFRPVLVICGFTIMALLTVLGAHFYRSRKHHYHTSLAQMAEGIEGGKNSHAYQELCRQRVGETSPRSKSSSTSSWCGDETQAPAIDISTGHVVLSFLQEFLSDPSKIEAQWDSLKEYRNHQKHTQTASQFVEKNRECLPFDEHLVEVETWKPEEKAYINASFLYDDDPRQAVYIAAQSPRGEEIAAWWQAVWQHGVCLIVNLSTLDETKAEKSYWPETGSQVHGPFEIHLVSEHIWSDDYLVRSFYLKNLQNGETRTITQFHYLSWKKDSTPPSAKSLLEFRRKVNKSYRGRSSPVLVHSWDGVGRVGVYCTLDLLCARLLRGVRQIDVAASVEHLRDQRDGMVRNGDQFKLIYGCLAQEVSALLKSAST